MLSTLTEESIALVWQRTTTQNLFGELYCTTIFIKN